MSELPEKIRAFIAVRLPDSVRAQVAEVQRQLKPNLPDVTWTRPEAMHLTLQFLGDIESHAVTNLGHSLRDDTRALVAFDLQLAAVGSFGNRVLWIGLARGEEPLQQLAAAVHQATGEFAAHQEARAFHPHVTMGRCRRPVRGLNAALREVRLPDFESWRANEFELIRSELSPHGSRYTILDHVPLSEAARPFSERTR